ncbi:MAG: hypothetical protein ACMXYL_05155 [Candidatus Woesearchaeota archaeon]
MEAVEIAIYIGIAIIAGGAIIYFLAGMEPSTLISPIRKMLGLEEETVSSARVHYTDFYAKLYDVWRSCGYGSHNMTVVYNVHGTSSISMEDVFHQYKVFNLCRTMQSHTFDCGSGQTIMLVDNNDDPLDEDDYEDFYWDLPATIIVSCDDTNRRLKVST